MREIKFRGKRVDNNQWVYGYYFTTPLTIENFGAGHLGDGIKRHCISTDMGVVYAVIPETVGQFICFKDKNGKEIYEDDVMQIVNGKCKVDMHYSTLYHIEHHKIEVIGNIHDNKELLKEN